jgi:hypothetical protein
MTTETITLAQALKQRKRLAQRIGQIDQRIGKNNSVPQGNVRDASPRELLAERARLVDQLVAVKMAVLRGNDGIQEKVLRIAEIKGEITLLNGLDTKHGQQDSPAVVWRQGPPVVYDAELKQPEVDERVRALEAQIDAIQEEIDRYNYTTRIEVPAVML